MNCRNKTLSAREVARFLCKRVIANEGFDDIEIEGKLVCVGRDFIAIKTDDKEVFYLPLCNVRNISVVSDKNCCDKDRRKVCNDTFRSILRKLINCQVRVNDGGDEEIEGVLTAVNRRTIQIVEEDSLNIVTIPIGSINFIVQAGENGDDESSNCGILCCKKEDPCRKKKHDCKKESSSKCCNKEDSCRKKKHDCKKESSSKCCKKESSSNSFTFWCKKDESSSSSSSSNWCNESSSNDFCCKKKNKHHKKRKCEDTESRDWFIF